VCQLGVPGLHFHDLRHTGNTLAAATGASLRDLMARMGHDSSDAAIIYQHTSDVADLAISAAVNEVVMTVLVPSPWNQDGTANGT
jgi:integrase